MTLIIRTVQLYSQVVLKYFSRRKLHDNLQRKRGYIMKSRLLCVMLFVAVASANDAKTQAILRDLVKGQLDVIKHCVGFRRLPFRGNHYPERPQKGHTVAFHARSSKDLKNLSDKQRIVFDIADVNQGKCYNTQDGKCYNTKDGTFTAPRNGFYVFHWTILTHNRGTFGTELVVDNDLKGRNYAHAGNTADHVSASQMAIVFMNKGQKAWLRIHPRHGRYMIGQYWSTFSCYIV